MKLTKPQRRILEDACRDGETVVWGRNSTAVYNLDKLGLVKSDWQNQPSAQGYRWRIVVKPTDAGRAAIA